MSRNDEGKRWTTEQLSNRTESAHRGIHPRYSTYFNIIQRIILLKVDCSSLLKCVSKCLQHDQCEGWKARATERHTGCETLSLEPVRFPQVSNPRCFMYVFYFDIWAILGVNVGIPYMEHLELRRFVESLWMLQHIAERCWVESRAATSLAGRSQQFAWLVWQALVFAAAQSHGLE